VFAFRTSNTHYKDPAVSVRKSQDCGNIQKPACSYLQVCYLEGHIIGTRKSGLKGHDAIYRFDAV
jgi:hypothetical protein